jgi:hypothetical protein
VCLYDFLVEGYYAYQVMLDDIILVVIIGLLTVILVGDFLGTNVTMMIHGWW